MSGLATPRAIDVEGVDSTIPFLTVDRDGFIRHANTSCLSAFGYRAPDLIGRTVNEITAWDSRCTRPSDQMELFSHRLGGVTTWLHARGYSVRTIVVVVSRICGSEPLFGLGFVLVTAEADAVPDIA